MSNIALLDCNNFFVSCERIFRPDLQGKPVAVLSSNDGCIVARSEEVKELGVPMGVPHFKVRDLCQKEKVTLFSSNFKLYRDISKRVMHTLKEEYPDAEIYSVDEAFFNVEDAVDEEKMARLREKVLKNIGIPVSIGVSSTKTLAKVAAKHAKKGSGVQILDEEEWKKVQERTYCSSIWGIGRQTAAKLAEDNINTVQEFLLLDKPFVRKKYGVHGERLQLELSGQSVHPVGGGGEPLHQSMTSSRSFEAVTDHREVVESALSYHADHLARKLRERGWMASRISIHISPGRHSDYRFRRGNATVELTLPTDNTNKITKTALTLLEDILDREVPYKKAGVTLSHIVSKEYVSRSLFDEEEARDNILDRTLDAINGRFGSGTLHLGSLRASGGPKTNAKLRSPEYVTNWQDIRVVKASG